MDYTGPMQRDDLERFLREPVIARLATVKRNGAPYVVPLWFEYDGSDFYIVARERSAYVAHIKRNPKAALSIAMDVPPIPRVLVEGVAEAVEGPSTSGRWVDIAHRMAVRYVGEPDGPRYLQETLDWPRVLVRIVPEKVTTWVGAEWHRKYTAPPAGEEEFESET